MEQCSKRKKMSQYKVDLLPEEDLPVHLEEGRLDLQRVSHLDHLEADPLDLLAEDLQNKADHLDHPAEDHQNVEDHPVDRRKEHLLADHQSAADLLLADLVAADHQSAADLLQVDLVAADHQKVEDHLEVLNVDHPADLNVDHQSDNLRINISTRCR